MSGAPLISVVMSVYNDQEHVAGALDSILSQQGVDLEFIVIDDGSRDGTGAILDAYVARDARLQVVHQENAGLTRALIRGCGMARGKYIARQDGGGDASLPGRLGIQSDFLDANPDVVMVSCGTRFLGPEGELLYEVIKQSDDHQIGLENLDPIETRGPSHHGSTMFQKKTYQAVGGYRSEFTVAQDQDLWLRLSEVGRCVAIPKVLYQARFTSNSISAVRREDQLLAKSLLLASAKRRRAGLEDNDLLKILNEKIPLILEESQPKNEARFYYFIGSVLEDYEPAQAMIYFRKALKLWPLFPRANLRFCLLKLVRSIGFKH